MYGKPSEKFLKDQALKQSLASEKKYYPEARGFKTASAAGEDKLLETEGPVPAKAEPATDLLDLGGPTS